jgi:hypothetical protein
MIYAKPTKQYHFLANYLAENKRITTVDARKKLGILHPAGRAKELRGLGFDIAMIWVDYITESGRKTQIGCYILQATAKTEG